MATVKDIIKTLPWRRISIVIGAALLIVVGMMVAGLIYIDTNTGRTQLAAALNKNLKTPDSTVHISGFDGSFYSDLTIPSITIADKDGIWLEITNAKLSWSVLPLLSKRLDISDLEIEAVNIARAPVPSTSNSEPDNEPFSLPSLPLDIEISNYAINQLKVSEAFANIASEFKIDGVLFLTKLDGIDAKMNLASTTGYQDAVKVDITYPDAGKSLDVEIDILAPQDGLILSLSGLELQNDVIATLTGTGPLNNWRGTMNARAGDQSIISAALEHKDQNTNIDADLDISKFIPDEFVKLVGGTNNFNLNLSPTERSKENNLNLTITNEIAQLNAQGILSFDEPISNDAVNFTLELINTDGINEFIAPSYVKPTRVDGVINNLASNPSFKVNVSSLALGVEEAVGTTITGEITGTLKNQVITINSSGRAEQIVGSAVDAVSGLVRPGINWSLNANVDQKNARIQIEQLTVGNDIVPLSATAQLNNETGELSADIKSDIDNIKAVAAALNLTQSISGSVNAGIKIIRSADDTPINALFDVTTTDLDLGNEIINNLIGPSPTFSMQINQNSSGAITLSDTTLDASIIKFEANADISAEQLIDDAQFKLSLVDIENITSLDETSLAGNIDILGSLSGDITAPSLTVETGFNQVTLQNLELSNVVAQLNADNILGDIEGKLEVQSSSNFGNISASTRFNKQGENISIPALSFILGAYEIAGSLDIPFAKPVSGSVNLITHEINDTSDVIAGEVTALITLSDDNNNQRVSLDSNAADINLPIGESDIVTLKAGQIAATILMEDDAPKITANATLTDFMHPRIQIKEATLDIDQNEAGISYTSNLIGSEVTPFTLVINGDVLQDPSGTQEITIALDGTINEEIIKLLKPAHILIDQENINVPKFTMQIGDGDLSGNFEQNSTGRTAALKVINTDLSIMKPFVPELPFTGLLNADVDLQSTQENLTSGFNLNLSNVFSEEQNLTSDDNITMTVLGKVNEKNTDISGTIKLKDSFNSNFSLAIPIEINPVSLTTNITENTPIKGVANWSGDVAPIWPALKLIDHDLSGDLAANLTFGGTISSPDIDGKIILENGRYENMQTGFIAADIDTSATVLDRKFTLDKFSANDGESGTISATANIDINPDFSYSAKADLTLANTHIVRQPELQITASSNLTFIKSNAATRLSGNITVDNADIGALTQGGPVIAKLDVTEINAEGNVSKASTSEEALGPIDLNLKLLVPGKLFIRSFGLDSEWKADLTIAGSSEEPVVNGTAELVRGFFEFSGKRFNLTRGSFTFPGNKSNDPIIEIAAEHQLSDMLANLRIYGLASRPSLEMSSTPYLPENEVLARILFGTSVAQLTAIEAVQLASAVHSLSNGGGQGLMGGIRRALGVDRLSIDNDNSREYGTTITGGKYLTDNVYVEVSTAPATGETATSVEVGLTRTISLVTRRTLDHDNNLSIKWFRDY